MWIYLNSEYKGSEKHRDNISRAASSKARPWPPGVQKAALCCVPRPGWACHCLEAGKLWTQDTTPVISTLHIVLRYIPTSETCFIFNKCSHLVWCCADVVWMCCDGECCWLCIICWPVPGQDARMLPVWVWQLHITSTATNITAGKQENKLCKTT